MDPKTAIEKLQILLPHWVEHNQHHAAEFKKWAAAGNLAALLEQAAANMIATDELLKKAVAEVGGTTAEVHHHLHDHAHGHDH